MSFSKTAMPSLKTFRTFSKSRSSNKRESQYARSSVSNTWITNTSIKRLLVVVVHPGKANHSRRHLRQSWLSAVEMVKSLSSQLLTLTKPLKLIIQLVNSRPWPCTTLTRKVAILFSTSLSSLLKLVNSVTQRPPRGFRVITLTLNWPNALNKNKKCSWNSTKMSKRRSVPSRKLKCGITCTKNSHSSYSSHRWHTSRPRTLGSSFSNLVSDFFLVLSTKTFLKSLILIFHTK